MLSSAIQSSLLETHWPCCLLPTRSPILCIPTLMPSSWVCSSPFWLLIILFIASRHFAFGWTSNESRSPISHICTLPSYKPYHLRGGPPHLHDLPCLYECYSLARPTEQMWLLRLWLHGSLSIVRSSLYPVFIRTCTFEVFVP